MAVKKDAIFEDGILHPFSNNVSLKKTNTKNSRIIQLKWKKNLAGSKKYRLY
jgi:hypothetical protein